MNGIRVAMRRRFTGSGVMTKRNRKRLKDKKNSWQADADANG
jgi:hypothetical protein